jgi:hypothetical protein
MHRKSSTTHQGRNGRRRQQTFKFQLGTLELVVIDAACDYLGWLESRVLGLFKRTDAEVTPIGRPSLSTHIRSKRSPAIGSEADCLSTSPVVPPRSPPGPESVGSLKMLPLISAAPSPSPSGTSGRAGAIWMRTSQENREPQVSVLSLNRMRSLKRHRSRREQQKVRARW